MIPLHRPPLSAELSERLRQRRARLSDVDLSTAAVRRAWKNARTERDGLRGALLTMAAGHARCMYCCDSAGTDIDHFQPIALAPLRAFDWLNHLLACSHCNSNQKRELYPCDEASGECLLIDPSREDPGEHLQLLFSSGRYRGVTEKGRQTIAVFGLNTRIELVRGRIDAFLLCKDTLRSSALQVAAGRHGYADDLLKALSRRPNGDVLHAMLAQRHLPDAPRMFGTDAVRGLRQLAAALAAST